MFRLAFTATMIFLGLAFVGEAQAKTCKGQAFGIKNDYDQEKGGFLAVRTGPNASAEQVEELHNGDPVDVLDRKGKWYLVVMPGSNPLLKGWVNGRWLKVKCQ